MVMLALVSQHFILQCHNQCILHGIRYGLRRSFIKPTQEHFRYLWHSLSLDILISERSFLSFVHGRRNIQQSRSLLWYSSRLSSWPSIFLCCIHVASVPTFANIISITTCMPTICNYIYHSMLNLDTIYILLSTNYLLVSIKSASGWRWINWNSTAKHWILLSFIST